MSLKLQIMKVLKNQKNQPKLFEEVIEHLKIEYERLSKEKIARVKMDLERKIEELEREIKFSKVRMGGFGPGRRKLKCYKCGEVGHISKFCQSKEVKNKFEYSDCLSSVKAKRRKYMGKGRGV